jgi:2-iminoacetate synthase ThiH
MAEGGGITMDEISMFGETYEERKHTERRKLHVRYYRGRKIPWISHDCNEANSCKFCRWRKREYKKELKENHLYELGHSKDCLERMLDGDGCSCLCNGDTAGL